MNGKLQILENSMEKRIFKVKFKDPEKRQFVDAVKAASSFSRMKGEAIFIIYPESPNPGKVVTIREWKELMHSRMRFLAYSDILRVSGLLVSSGVRNAGMTPLQAWRSLFACKQAVLTESRGKPMIIKAPVILMKIEDCDILQNAIPLFRLVE